MQTKGRETGFFGFFLWAISEVEGSNLLDLSDDGDLRTNTACIPAADADSSSQLSSPYEIGIYSKVSNALQITPPFLKLCWVGGPIRASILAF
jgi:hypothetical protein